MVGRAGWNSVINHHFEILSGTRARVGLSRGCLLSLVYSGGVCRTALFLRGQHLCSLFFFHLVNAFFSSHCSDIY